VPHVVDDGFGVWVHVLVPLHVFVMQEVSVHVTEVPAHAPPEQASL